MVGRQENTVKTLVRIEAIVLQGLLMGLLLAALGVALMPLVPFVIAVNRWRRGRESLRFVSRLVLFPLWLLSGILYAAFTPFVIFGKTIYDLRDVVAVEWANRTEEGQPLDPSGHPIELPSAEERAMRDIAHTVGVIRDYNGEARRYGQGLPIDETQL